MPDSKYFGIPFGSSGDKATIPEATQPSGAISWQQGFGPDYERDPATDPLAKRVPRDETNEFYFQVSNALRFLQLYGLPEWYTVDDSGNDVSYPITARVRHAGKAWVSIAATNTAEPGTDPTKWVEDVAFNLPDLEASAAEMIAGTLGTKIVTPRRAAAVSQSGGYVFAVAGGSANAITAGMVPAIAALTTGMQLRLRLTATNTGAVTLNVSGLGALPLTDIDGSALPAGALVSGRTVPVWYDGAGWRLVDARAATTAEMSNALAVPAYVTPAALAAKQNPYLDTQSVVASVPSNVWTVIPAALVSSSFVDSTYSAGVLTIGPKDAGTWLFIASAYASIPGTATWQQQTAVFLNGVEAITSSQVQTDFAGAITPAVGIMRVSAGDQLSFRFRVSGTSATTSAIGGFDAMRVGG